MTLNAKLQIAAYADDRGPQTYNQSLSERRGQSVKDYLIASGVPADKIEVSAYGDDKLLDKSAVDQLQTANPNPATRKPSEGFACNFNARSQSSCRYHFSSNK